MIIELNIPDDKKDAIIEAFSLLYKYPEEVPNPEYMPTDPESEEIIENPTSKLQFAKNIIKNFIQEVYVSAQVKPIEESKASVIQIATEEANTITVT